VRNSQDEKKVQISSDTRDGYPVVTVTGEIDLYTAPRFQETLETAAKNSAVLIVDLSLISYIDSAGLSVLLLMYKRLSARRGTLYVVSPPGNLGVRRVIEVTRLDSLVSIRPTLDDVLRELNMRRAA